MNTLAADVMDQILTRQGHEACDGVEIRENISIGSIAGGPPVFATMFRPVAPSARSNRGLLAFHGGGFRNGHPNGQGMLGKYLALAFGVTTLSPTYRLATADRKTFPEVLQDGVLAWRWIVAQSAELGIDPNRICVSGDSAGVLLSGHLAVRSPLLGLRKDEPVPAGWIANWGPIDFVARWYDRGESAGAEDWLLGTHYAADPQKYHEASILTHAKAPLPPTVFVYGREDRVVHARQGALGVAAWKAAGARASLHVIHNIGHGIIGDNRDERLQILQAASDFWQTL